VQVNVPVKFQELALDVTINPGDYIVADLNGVVCVPLSLLSEVVALLPKQVEIDDNMATAIASGSTFADASSKFRGR
jgi:regulator of RNase E activity RraA